MIYIEKSDKNYCIDCFYLIGLFFILKKSFRIIFDNIIAGIYPKSDCKLTFIG